MRSREIMTSIRRLVARRSDLSTFLVHLTRNSGEETAKDRLISILETNSIEARTPFGAAVAILKDYYDDIERDLESQAAVCFTETPLEHLHLLLEQIEERQIQYEPYGIAFTKPIGRRTGVNPVWYVDMTPGHDWLTNHVNKLITEALEPDEPQFEKTPIARIAPFFEQMGTWDNGKKEFWWEREWRHVGDFDLPEHYLVLCPEDEFGEVGRFCSEGTKFVDPRWGLEEIIAHLAGFDEVDIGTFE